MPTPFKITELFAWVATDPADGSDGVLGYFDTSRKTWEPLVGADMVRIEAHRHVAEQIQKKTGTTVKLCKFSQMTVLEVIGEKKETIQ